MSYKKEQRKAEQAYKNRGTVRWVSCEIVRMPKLGQDGKPISDEDGKPSLIYFKKAVQGTYRNRTSPKLSKAEKKLNRKRNHTKKYYLQQRQLSVQ